MSQYSKEMSDRGKSKMAAAQSTGVGAAAPKLAAPVPNEANEPAKKFNHWIWLVTALLGILVTVWTNAFKPIREHLTACNLEKAQLSKSIAELHAQLTAVTQRVDQVSGILPIHRMVLSPNENAPSSTGYDFIKELNAYIPKVAETWEHKRVPEENMFALVSRQPYSSNTNNDYMIDLWLSPESVSAGSSGNGTNETIRSYVGIQRLQKETMVESVLRKASRTNTLSSDEVRTIRKLLLNDPAGFFMMSFLRDGFQDTDSDSKFQVLEAQKSEAFSYQRTLLEIEQSVDKTVYIEKAVVTFNFATDVVIIISTKISDNRQPASEGFISSFMNALRVRRE
jgi:hypothetical protein